MTAQPVVADVPRLDLVSRPVDGWLVLGAELPEPPAGWTPWALLLRASASPGLSKLVLEPAAQTVAVRADVPVEDGIDVAGRVREAREGMARLAELVFADGRAAEDSAEALSHRSYADAASGAAHVPGSSPLAAMVAEAGWTFVERASGCLAVDLGIPGQFCQAAVEPRGSGGCRARVEVVRLGDATVDVRAALAVLLLTLAHVTRLVRAGAAPADGLTRVFIEVDIERAVTLPELHRALSALSVANRMAAREARALTDPDVARSYLAARWWAV